VFAFDDEGELLEHRPFKGSPAEVAALMASDAEEESLARALEAKGHEVVCESKIEGFEHDPGNLARRILTERMYDIALDLGLYDHERKVQALVRDVALQMASSRLAPGIGKDLQGAQAVRALDDLDMIIDRLGQRLREWFLSLYPGYAADMPEPRDFADAMASRYPWTTSKLHKDNLEKMREVLFAEGGPGQGGVVALRDLASRQSDLFLEREKLETLVSTIMVDASPVLSEVAGPILAARLVAEAGGLESLAKMPTTTVQILGARRAVFRHIRSGDRPPKHGVIFIHPSVSTAKRWQRGKIAKVLAGFIVRAARTDAFGGSLKGIELRKDFEKHLTRIKRAMRDPPRPRRHEAPRKKKKFGRRKKRKKRK
jgi:nucleolar protein 56